MSTPPLTGSSLHVFGFPTNPVPQPDEWDVSLDDILKHKAASRAEALAFGTNDFVDPTTKLLIDKITKPMTGGSATPLADAFAGLVFNTDFTTKDDNGNANCYEICWLVSDIIHGYFLIAQFQQNSDGTHQSKYLLYQQGLLIQTNTTPVTVDLLGNPSPVKPFGTGDTIQFYLNSDRTLQVFWYRNGPIVFGQNDGIPTDFTITDETLIAMPMEGSKLVTFAGFQADGQIGQIFQTVNHVPTQYALDSPFEVRAPTIASNLSFTFKGTHAGIEGIDFSATSP